MKCIELSSDLCQLCDDDLSIIDRRDVWNKGNLIDSASKGLCELLKIRLSW